MTRFYVTTSAQVVHLINDECITIVFTGMGNKAYYRMTINHSVQAQAIKYW